MRLLPLLAGVLFCAVFAAAGSSHPVALNYASPSWSPDGRQLVFVSAFGPSGQVLLARADGRNIRPIARAALVTRVVWSPDGLRIAYVSRGEIFVVRRDGSGRVRVGSGAGVAWSPDSTKLAFDSGWKGPIRVVGSDGGGAHVVADGAYDRAPAWSPDGQRLVFSRADAPGARASLYVVGVDGSGLRALGIQGADPSWSPDGSRLAFWLNTRDGVALATTTLDGFGVVVTRSLPAYSGPARWSPDGTKLAFTPCGEFGACRVDVAAADASFVTILGSGAEPVWSPDGTRVAFTARRFCRTSSIFTIGAGGERLSRLTPCRR